MEQNRKPFPIAEYDISIQASSSHYCSPKISETHRRLHEYGSVEVAIIHRDNGSFLRPSDISLNLISWDKYWEKGRVPVAGYVDFHLVALLISLMQSEVGRRDWTRFLNANERHVPA